jgi:hypothetical protein
MADKALDVYFNLAMEDKVRLLKNPHGRLSPGLVQRLSRFPGTVAGEAVFTSNEPKGTGFRLSPSLAGQLDHIEGYLDEWWTGLDPEDQDHLIEHRAEQLAAEYAPVVLAAGDGKPEGLIVAVVRDNKTGRFRLPPMIRVYVELQAPGA